MSSRGALHFAVGVSAAGVLQRAFALSEEMVWALYDYLSCGPLPPLGSDLEGWSGRRREYWRENGAPWTADLLTSSDPTERLKYAERITAWIGTGLADQLSLLWLYQVADRLDIDRDRIEVVQLARDPGSGFEVVNLGFVEATSQLFANATGRRLTAEELDEVNRSWRAATASDPEALLDRIRAENPRLPALHRSLQAVLDRYPAQDSGLPIWDRELLKYAREKGPKAASIIGYTMGHNDGPDWVGDDYLFGRLLRLGRGSVPALVLEGDETEMRFTKARLTEDGGAMLRGERNYVELNGLDDWVLGVHLESSARRVWYRHNRGLVRARTD